MSRQISGNINWPWPAMFRENNHSDLVELANNANYNFEKGAKFKIVFVAEARSNGWHDSWVDTMGSVGDEIILDQTAKFGETSGIRFTPSSFSTMRSYHYPIFSVAPMGYNIVYGDMISKNAYDALCKQSKQKPFVVAYTYEIDNNIVNVMFSDENRLSFELKGNKFIKHNWANGIFSEHGLNLWKFIFVTEEGLCQEIQK